MYICWCVVGSSDEGNNDVEFIWPLVYGLNLSSLSHCILTVLPSQFCPPISFSQFWSPILSLQFCPPIFSLIQLLIWWWGKAPSTLYMICLSIETDASDSAVFISLSWGRRILDHLLMLLTALPLCICCWCGVLPVGDWWSPCWWRLQVLFV